MRKCPNPKCETEWGDEVLKCLKCDTHLVKITPKKYGID